MAASTVTSSEGVCLRCRRRCRYQNTVVGAEVSHPGYQTREEHESPEMCLDDAFEKYFSRAKGSVSAVFLAFV